MKRSWVIPTVAVLALSLRAGAQTEAPAAAPAAACPVELTDLRADTVRITVKNTSGKKITGMMFNVAISDATENWRWLHWYYDDSLPLREFGSTHSVDAGESKKLNWDRLDLEREFRGGVAMVLIGILFADGSSWQDDSDSGACKGLWHNHHKSGFSKPVDLPPRGPSGPAPPPPLRMLFSR